MKPTHVSESQAIANARNVLGSVEVVYVEHLEAGRGIDEAFDQPEQTEYNCYIREDGKLKLVCTIYERNGRILGYYPYKPTGHCYDCGMVFCHEEGRDRDHPELGTIYEALTNSDAEFRTESAPIKTGDDDRTLMCDYCKPPDIDPEIRKRYGSLLAVVLHQAALDSLGAREKKT